ncbi:MAG: cellulase family glycosylhydrolase [Planctomycetota bacterium]
MFAHSPGRSAILLLVLMLAAGFVARAAEAQWQVRVKDDAALELTYEGKPVVTSGWRGWGRGWDYAGTNVRFQDQEGALKRYAGRVRTADAIPQPIPLQVGVRAPGGRKLGYSITASPGQSLSGIVGCAFAVRFGGIGTTLDYTPRVTFHYAGDRSATVGTGPGPAAVIRPEDEELAGQPLTALTWHLPEGRELRIDFAEPTPASLERSGLELRVWYLRGDTPAGPQTTEFSITLPQGTRLGETLKEKYGPADTENWLKGALQWNSSPVDLSFLNHKPAGKHGFVRAEDGDFVFEDGTPVRFWGGNIAAYAIFSDKQSMPAQARRIAAMGFNLMRIHHHDSMGWVSPTVIDKSKNHSQSLNAEAMDRLDYLIHCLKQEGVYVWLDLHVGRQLKPGDDVPGYDEMDKDGDGQASLKGYSYYNDRIEQLMKEFNQKYLAHRNPYTELAYKDDPAIMGLLVTNENELTTHFGNKMLPDKNNPYHNRIFDRRVRAFCERTGYPYEETWKTWLPGPSKRYLNYEQAQWQSRMTQHLRQTVGVRAPIVANQFWAGMGMADLPALAGSDFIDVHSYGGGDTLPLSVSPRFGSNFVVRIVAGQVAGRPVSVTEWNSPYPTSWRSVSPMYVASIGALQGWDAPMIYNYSQRAFRKPGRTRRWTSYYDPGLMAPMPNAALAFRQGHLRRAEKTALFALSEDQTFNQDLSDGNMPALRTLAEQHRVQIVPAGVEADVPADVTVRDPSRDFLPEGADSVRSDTGQIYRNWSAGIQVFDSPRTKGAQGLIGYGDNGRLIEIDGMEIGVEDNFGVVLAGSLDREPLGESGRILITAIGRTLPTDGGLPFLSEPLTGTVRIRNANAGMKLVPLGPGGQPLEVITPERDGEWYEVRLSPELNSHWFLLQRRQG